MFWTLEIKFLQQSFHVGPIGDLKTHTRQVYPIFPHFTTNTLHTFSPVVANAAYLLVLPRCIFISCPQGTAAGGGTCRGATARASGYVFGFNLRAWCFLALHRSRVRGSCFSIFSIWLCLHHSPLEVSKPYMRGSFSCVAYLRLSCIHSVTGSLHFIMPLFIICLHSHQVR